MFFFFLSDAFYKDYANCPEIELKRTRLYVQACIRVDGVYFAVPLRSNIKHKYVLWTDEASRCGLDFSKTVVILKQDYIDRSEEPHIRQNEFDSLRGKEYIVRQRLIQYINTYKKAKNRIDVPRNQKVCEYSTLQYFEKYLYMRHYNEMQTMQT